MGARPSWLGDGNRRRWRATMRDLGIRPTSMEELLREVVTARGNKLVLTTDRAFITPGGPLGRWQTSQDLGIDLVWHHPDITGTQRDQVLGHECGHMVNGDESPGLNYEALEKAITSRFEALDPEFVQSALTRASFGKKTERGAEQFSDWANAWIARNRKRSDDPLLDNLRASLGSGSDDW